MKASRSPSKLTVKNPRLVSGVRDFPPGCGRSSSINNGNAFTHVDGVRDLPSRCVKNASLEASAFDRVYNTKSNVKKEGVVVPRMKKPESQASGWRRGKVAVRSKPADGSLSERKTEELADSNMQQQQLERPRMTTPRLGQPSSSSSSNTSAMRHKVDATLRRFRELCRELEIKKSREGATGLRRIDYHAARRLKEEGGFVNTGPQILGEVPGVEVGDVYLYRMELNIVGLHRQTQAGIDFATFGDRSLATSVVASGGYADDLKDLNSLTYTGQGGNVMSRDKDPLNQELSRGNLALKNSMEVKNRVRVIRGNETLDKESRNYIYLGLYQVKNCWKEMGPHGKHVFKFQLDRIEGQKPLGRN